MATVDLSNYNLSELRNLQSDIDKEIKNRQQQEVKKAREQIRAIAQDLGVSIEDLLANTSGKPDKNSGKVAAQRYRNPADDAQTWSGRGRQPKWVVEALAKGSKLEEFRI
jgi:DNA-binding protein H-NS